MQRKLRVKFYLGIQHRMPVYTWNGMSSSFNPSIDSVRKAERIAEAEVRVLRADQHLDCCHDLVDGQQAVLKAYGIKKLTTFNRDWIGDQSVIVIAAVAKGAVVDGKTERVL